jgi:transcriptional regulator of acetoin/glycerol metabolism
MRRLLDYDWPGNVRELKNALEFAVIHAEGPAVAPGDLPPEVRERAAGGRDAAGDAAPFPEEASPPERDSAESEDSARSEEDRVRAALQAASGNRTEAAKLLGVSRATLYRRLDEFDIG